MKKIFFATANQEKLNEARSILGLDVVGTPLKIDEIQSLDPVEVAVKKAQAYHQVLKKPIFVEDISFFIKSVKGLPGPYIDAFLKSLGAAAIAALVKSKKDKSALAQATVVYIDQKGKEHVFTGQTRGQITNPRGKNGFGWDPIFTPQGSKKTFGEMNLTEKNQYSMRKKALMKFKKWLSLNKLS